MKSKKKVYKIFIDGISKGKKGPAGFGVVIIDPKGEKVCSISEFVETATFDQIQFKAFVKALNEIRKRKIPYADIYSHSDILVRQLQGIYRIMDPVIKQLRNVVSRQFSNSNFDIHLISALKNLESTRLAEDAIKREAKPDPPTPLLKMRTAKDLKPTKASKTDTQCSAGGVVYKKEGQRYKICMIAKRNKTVWALPKGRVAKGETPEVTAVREVAEETGHLARVKAKIDQINYYFYWKDNDTFYHKFVYFYLMPLEKENATQRDQEADAVIWIPIKEAYKKATYLNEKDIIKKAQNYLK